MLPGVRTLRVSFTPGARAEVRFPGGKLVGVLVTSQGSDFWLPMAELRSKASFVPAKQGRGAEHSIITSRRRSESPAECRQMDHGEAWPIVHVLWCRYRCFPFH
ncbi:unnamed protein product [Effrenium voratum]|nr:unnamed protein product [Effrenium voratum]